MKFLYEYRTPDNEKRNGTICAADREAAYAALKKQGIRPSRFSEAPGFFNKLFGKGKRWIAIGVLCALCFVLCAVVYTQGTRHEAQGTLDASLDSPTRRQPIGDIAIIDKGIREGWSGVFALEGDRFLASFAVPGTAPAIRSTTEEEILKALSTRHQALSTRSDGLEARQIVAMVSGMKQELREFIADGGTIRQYGRRLVQRQEEELGYYHRAKAELDRAIAEKRAQNEINALVERHNAALRKIGVKLLVLPE